MDYTINGIYELPIDAHVMPSWHQLIPSSSYFVLFFFFSFWGGNYFVLFRALIITIRIYSFRKPTTFWKNGNFKSRIWQRGPSHKVPMICCAIFSESIWWKSLAQPYWAQVKIPIRSSPKICIKKNLWSTGLSKNLRVKTNPGPLSSNPFNEHLLSSNPFIEHL